MKEKIEAIGGYIVAFAILSWIIGFDALVKSAAALFLLWIAIEMISDKVSKEIRRELRDRME